MKRAALIAALVFALIAAAASLGHAAPALLTTTRWLAIAALVAYALFRRSLTTWIFVAMIAGAEVGHGCHGRRRSSGSR